MQKVLIPSFISERNESSRSLSEILYISIVGLATITLSLPSIACKKKEGIGPNLQTQRGIARPRHGKSIENVKVRYERRNFSSL